jgi:hypothetical protein
MIEHAPTPSPHLPYNQVLSQLIRFEFYDLSLPSIRLLLQVTIASPLLIPVQVPPSPVVVLLRERLRQ